MFWRCYCIPLCLIAVFSHLTSCSNLTVFFEDVEADIGTVRHPYRSNATNLGTIHLYKGDQVEILLCADDPVKLKLGALRYSNDGGSDIVTVSLADSLVTVVNTHANTGGFGHYWNQFGEKVIKDTYVNLDVGEHVLLFAVPDADCYGVELDTLVLTTDVPVDQDVFVCGKSLLRAPEPSPCSPPEVTTITTTTTTTTTEATPSASPVPLMSSTAPRSNPLVEQLSKPSVCLDEENVNIKFSPRKLDGLEILAYSSDVGKIKPPASITGVLPMASKCSGTIWELGTADSSNAEFGGTDDIWSQLDFAINNEPGEAALFPREILPSQTSKIIIRYFVRSDIFTGRGKVLFTLGLVNVTKDAIVGVQYYDRSKTEQEEAKAIKFSAKQQVVSWDLPARSVSPSLENQLHIFFDSSNTDPILFDFLRLDSIAKPERTKPQVLAKSKLYSVRGTVYASSKKRPATKGMKVVADNKVSEHVEELSLSVRPQGKGRLNSVLTITEDGKIVPRHDTIKSVRGTRKYKGSVLEGLSGFIFGNGSGVKELIVDTATQMINLTYEDGSTLRLVFDYNPIRTKIVVLESTVNENTLHFVSTYLTDQLSAVNALVTRKGSMPDVRHILGSLDDVTSRQISFVRTSANSMFEANPRLDVIFPVGAV